MRLKISAKSAVIHFGEPLNNSFFENDIWEIQFHSFAAKGKSVEMKVMAIKTRPNWVPRFIFTWQIFEHRTFMDWNEIILLMYFFPLKKNKFCALFVPRKPMAIFFLKWRVENLKRMSFQSKLLKTALCLNYYWELQSLRDSALWLESAAHIR